jgi:hypothetical protein
MIGRAATLDRMASLTRPAAGPRRLAGALALLLAVAAGCSAVGGTPAQDAGPPPPAASAERQAGQGEVLSGFVAFGDFGGGPAQLGRCGGLDLAPLAGRGPGPLHPAQHVGGCRGRPAGGASHDGDDPAHEVSP